MSDNLPIETHSLEPFIPDEAKVLFLGTFPPKREKWLMDFYYPNRINDFWRIMGLIFHNDKNHFYDTALQRFRLDDIKQLLTEHHIALNDSARQVKRLRDNASDKYLEIITPVPLFELLDKMPECNDLVATGEKAAQTIAEIINTDIPAVGSYQEATTSFGRKLRLWRMPSTSRAYPLALEKKAEFYVQLFREIGIV